MRTVQIIQECEEKRLARGIAGLLRGEYRVELLESKDSSLKAFVHKPNGNSYAVVLSDDGSGSCSCVDAFRNNNRCKHMTMVAIFHLSSTVEAKKPKSDDSKAGHKKYLCEMCKEEIVKDGVALQGTDSIYAYMHRDCYRKSVNKNADDNKAINQKAA